MNDINKKSSWSQPVEPFWFRSIENEVDALSVAKNAGRMIIALSIFGLIFWGIIGIMGWHALSHSQDEHLENAVVGTFVRIVAIIPMVISGFFVYRKQNFIAAAICCLLASTFVVSVLLLQSMIMSIIISIVVLWISIRALMATLKLRKLRLSAG